MINFGDDNNRNRKNSPKEVGSDETDGIPAWLMSPQFLFGFAFALVIAGTTVWALLKSSWKSAAEEAASNAPVSACFEFADAEPYVPEDVPFHKEEIEKERGLNMRSANGFIGLAKDCEYGKCSGKAREQVTRAIEDYLKWREFKTRYYHSQHGVKGYKALSDIYRNSRDKEIYRYLKKGNETDGLEWLELSNKTNPIARTLIAANGGDIPPCNM
jgi:hypothetical protein